MISKHLFMAKNSPRRVTIQQLSRKIVFLYRCKQLGMNQRFTYSIPPHTLSFLATASHICAAEPSQASAEIIRADTCDTRRWMNPLAGIMSTHRNALGHRYSSPHGDGVLSVFKGSMSGLSQPTTNYSLLTAN